MTLWGHGYVNVINASSKYVGPCYYVNLSEFVEPSMLLMPVCKYVGSWYYANGSEVVGPLCYVNQYR